MRESSGKSQSNVCIAVLGATGVGKTAVTVRFLTKRYIGEYSSGSDMKYQYNFPYWGGLTTTVDILDASPQTVDDSCLERVLPVSTAFLVVYSLTDLKSLEAAQQIMAHLPCRAPRLLLANKADLEHRREVSIFEGQQLAEENDCPFFEGSAAENGTVIHSVFQRLIKQAIHHVPLCHPSKKKMFSVPRMLGTLVLRSALGRSFSSSSSSSSPCSMSPSQSALIIPEKKGIPIPRRPLAQVFSV